MTPKTLQDGEIIDLYFSRDESAIAASQDKYGAYCFVIANNILANDQDSEECVNDVWVTSWGLMPPERPTRLGAFFGGITRNKAFDRYKHNTAKKRVGVALPLEELAECASDESVEDEARRDEIIRIINGFLRDLSPRDCDMFVCRYYHAYSIESIAQAFALKENHVRTILSRTRAALRAHLERRGYL